MLICRAYSSTSTSSIVTKDKLEYHGQNYSWVSNSRIVDLLLIVWEEGITDIWLNLRLNHNIRRLKRLLLTYIKKTNGISTNDLAADVLVISLSVSFLWLISNIWRYDKFLMGEPNLLIRSLETAWFLLILAFGIGKCISDVRRIRKTRRSGS